MRIFSDGRLAALACLTAMAFVGAVAAEPVTTPTIRDRGLVAPGDTGRLAAVMAKARRGEEICVAAIGGSITAGGLQTKDPRNRYVALVAAWFTRTFPQAKVRFVNAGIGGTNSLFGAMRLRNHVLNKQPDLIIVEYAVNDNHPVPMFWATYEGVLRQALREPQHPALVQLFFMQRKGESAQTTQQMLGRHYDLPMVSFRDAWWPEIYAGRVQWETMYADVVHPNDTGHILAAELLINLLQQVNDQTAPAPRRTALPEPMISDFFADCRYAEAADLRPTENAGWVRTKDGGRWECPASGGTIEFPFEGELLFLGYEIDAAAEPSATYRIDGGSPRPLQRNPNRLPLAEGLTAGSHQIRIEYAPVHPIPPSGARLQVWSIGTAGKTAR